MISPRERSFYPHRRSLARTGTGAIVDRSRRLRQRFSPLPLRFLRFSATDAARFVLPSDADEEGMPPRRLGRVEHDHGAGARRDHRAVGEADPLAAVLIEELVAG